MSGLLISDSRCLLLIIVRGCGGGGTLRQNVFGVVRQFLGLGHQVQCGKNLRIGLCADFQAFLLAELGNKHFRFDL